MNHLKPDQGWDLIIIPKESLLDIRWKDLWRYRDLWRMFVKRDIITVYKQTILGPIWFFLQPIMTTVVYVVIFGRVAGISTDGIPQPLFYLSGIVFWNYFAQCLTLTSNTFRSNAGIFGKVYFPRLIVPLAVITSNLIRFLIQGFLLICTYLYYVWYRGVNLDLNWEYLWMLPILVVLMALIGLSFGLIFSAFTTKYRDLTFLLTFGVQLMMYATPVIYPMSMLKDRYQAFADLLFWNPMTHILESVKYILLGAGQFSWSGVSYVLIFTLVTFFMGLIIFNRTERNFIDTV
ncbi:MAG: ABC transporter permease [Cyclobacteriaceae bacterium]